MVNNARLKDGLLNSWITDRTISAFYNRQPVIMREGCSPESILSSLNFFTSIAEAIQNGVAFDDITVTKSPDVFKPNEVYMHSESELRTSLLDGYLMIGKEKNIEITHRIFDVIEDTIEHERKHRQVFEKYPGVFTAYGVSFYENLETDDILLQASTSFTGTLPLRGIIDGFRSPNHNVSYVDSIVSSLSVFDPQRKKGLI